MLNAGNNFLLKTRKKLLTNFAWRDNILGRWAKAWCNGIEMGEWWNW